VRKPEIPPRCGLPDPHHHAATDDDRNFFIDDQLQRSTAITDRVLQRTTPGPEDFIPTFSSA